MCPINHSYIGIEVMFTNLAIYITGAPLCRTFPRGKAHEKCHGNFTFQKTKSVGMVIPGVAKNQKYMALGQNLAALVNIKIDGKWMFTPLTLIIIGFDTHPYCFHYNRHIQILRGCFRIHFCRVSVCPRKMLAADIKDSPRDARRLETWIGAVA